MTLGSVTLPAMVVAADARTRKAWISWLRSLPLELEGRGSGAMLSSDCTIVRLTLDSAFVDMSSVTLRSATSKLESCASSSLLTKESNSYQ